ncbi:putative membrane protein [Thermacetogenium phaeum DSM 12270]|jgi:uncharacterized membrane protein|uniref:Putative membrane protein n=2 Tax=Thermacetogenium phaeum TaxID=85874 RepID=K4LT16_THEPS|nr:general stress protein [Thermacetogenium phaeum]AFV11199.1 putative membrane protein [Thermacetogenium phaeum DSM 12270]KUK36796.1 MAG: Putative membrane protein [Thermacetogenium phaeum]MDN5375589.1 hypothetical protein [Thermacetogenium sp.]
MGSVVLGVFDTREQAEQAASRLRDQGFHKDISIVAKEEKAERQEEGELRMGGDDTAVEGITTGGVLGGIAGLAAGAGALVIPGIGPLVALGPIAGLLSGAATGGLAGGLLDWGIPEEEGKHYEEDVRQGKILLSVQGSGPRLDEAANILRQSGAHDVKVF